jgi:MerR family transcriptional regulator, thiopeptide resistance regulator
VTDTTAARGRRVTYTVGEVAELAGVTVRTLHHYDELGLLPPSRRGANGYRRYSVDDLARLQRVRFYRELEFGLEEIATLLDGDDDPLVHLRRQHELLLDRRARLDRLVRTLERTMDARRSGVNLTPDEMFEVFGDEDPTEHAAEAEQRWGDTDAWRQSQARHRTYTKADYQRMKAAADDLNARFVAAMRAGEPADGPVAMGIAEEARQQIVDWHHDLSHAGHRSLATMYLADPRFTATYERIVEGLAVYVHDAIMANAARHGVDEDGW